MFDGQKTFGKITVKKIFEKLTLEKYLKKAAKRNLKTRKNSNVQKNDQ